MTSWWIPARDDLCNRLTSRNTETFPLTPHRPPPSTPPLKKRGETSDWIFGILLVLQYCYSTVDTITVGMIPFFPLFILSLGKFGGIKKFLDSLSLFLCQRWVLLNTQQAWQLDDACHAQRHHKKNIIFTAEHDQRCANSTAVNYEVKMIFLILSKDCFFHESSPEERGKDWFITTCHCHAATLLSLSSEKESRQEDGLTLD